MIQKSTRERPGALNADIVGHKPFDLGTDLVGLGDGPM